MSKIMEYYINAELSLATYANFTADITGTPYITALQNNGEGLSFTQAKETKKRGRIYFKTKKGTHLFLRIIGDCNAKEGKSIGAKLPTPYSTERT